MAKKAYIGVDGKARKVKRSYIGVDGKARKIRRGYIGVGGVARLCYSSVGTLSYYGTAAAANSATYYGHGAANSKYAVFGGGQPNGSTALATNTAYNADLTKVSCPDCSNTGGNKFAAGNSQYVFIPTKGGKIDTFNTSLTRKTITGWTWEEAPATGVLKKSDRVVYASSSAVKVINSNLTIQTVSQSSGGTYATAAPVDGGVVFGGGMTSTWNVYNSAMYGLNENLTVTSATALTGNNRRFTGPLNGCGIIAGGGEGTSKKADCVRYDGNFTQTKLANLPASRSFGASASLENYFLILGGEVGNGTGTGGTSNTVLSYDNNFTCSTAASMSRVFAGGAAAVIGNSALVWGGFSSTSWSWSSGPVTSAVDVYQEI